MATSADRLDASTRMSALFKVKIVTNRAEQQFATVDQALARLRRLNKSVPYTANAGVVIRPRTNRRSSEDNSYTQVFLGRATKRVEIKTQTAMAEAMEMGAKLVKRNLRFAITEYGLYRYFRLGRGRSAGRDDTGKMIDSVVWNTQRTVQNRSTQRTVQNRSTEARGIIRRGTRILGGTRNATITGFFGWDRPEVYMVAQEKGFSLPRAGTGRKQRSRPYVYRGRTSVEGAMALGASMIAARNHLINQLKKG